jgi:predicted dehydrogenase
MADKIRIGIVGATLTQGGSGWGANAHVPAIKALPDYELKAVCTAHEDTAKASAEAFGAELAFHDMDDMVAHPDIDLIVVCVRAPMHHELVMKAIRAGKNVFCEWPLGANLPEAIEMANGVKERSLRSFVGLQARSDPAIMYAHELVEQGHIGEVLSASLSVVGGAQLQRGPGRIWQGDRRSGANTLTIAGGHAIDSLCAIIGEFTEVSARISTRIKEWYTESGEPVPVDSPDNIIVAGQVAGGAEVAVHVASVPSNPSGTRIEIFGRDGAVAITASGRDRQVFAGKGRDPLAEMAIPERFTLVPEGTPKGSPYNVAQAYVRYADATGSTEPFDPDFDYAVERHTMIDAIERSSAEGRAVKLS